MGPLLQHNRPRDEAGPGRELTVVIGRFSVAWLARPTPNIGSASVLPGNAAGEDGSAQAATSARMSGSASCAASVNTQAGAAFTSIKAFKARLRHIEQGESS